MPSYICDMLIHSTAITSLTDARYFAAKEVHYLGFYLEEGTPEYLDPVYMKAINEWVEGPILTGWYFQTPIELVAEAAVFYGLGAVVLHEALVQADFQWPDTIEWHIFAKPNAPIMGKLDAFARPPQNIILDLHDIDLPSLKADTPGVERVREICRRRPTILFCADLRADTLPEYELLVPEAAGFCLSGAAEEKVGVKAFDDLEDLFDLLEARNSQ
jgi:phosphoribosylanthranilate isomerase